MPDSENAEALSTADYLEGTYGLTAEGLGLDGTVFTRRVGLWERLAAQRPGMSAEQRAAHVEVLALRAWQTQLMQEADKFRAEGDITVERDVMARVTQVGVWLTAAEAEAGLTPAAAGQVSANPAPEFGSWGLVDG